MQIHGDVIRFGIHSGPQNTTYPALVELWTRADELGFDWISVFDHFLPIYSDPTGPCFEGTAILAALAAKTERIRVAILVTGVTYRHPALAANIAATIDHISGGRLEYGVGAAWYDLEHGQYGIDFPRVGVRMDMLDEACHVMRRMWSQTEASFDGEHYTLTGAWMAPKPVQEHLPLVIGGAGEKRTLRIVAEHADVWNGFLSDTETFAHKLDVLRGHCEAVGRDFGDIRKSLTYRAILGDTEASARERADAIIPGLGQAASHTGFFIGTPEQLVETLRPFVALGAGDFLIASAAPYDYETIELVAERVAPAFR